MHGFLFCLALNFAVLTPDGSQSDNITGYWMNDTGEYIVKITRQENGMLAGNIVWLRDSLDNYRQPLRDVMNDEPSERSRLVKGLTILYDFKWNDDAWRYGTYYNYTTGNDYGIKMTLDGDGNLRLTGYYGILFFLGKTRIWTPVIDKSLYGLK